MLRWSRPEILGFAILVPIVTGSPAGPILSGSAGGRIERTEPAAGVDVATERYVGGDYERVIETLETVQQARRLDAREWLLKGAALMRLGRGGEARAAFLRAQAEDPGDPSPSLCLAEAELIEGDSEGARAHLRRPLVSREPRVRDYAEFLAVLIQLREGDRAGAARSAAAMRWPAATPGRLYALAAVAWVSDRRAEAEALRLEALEVFGSRAILPFDDALVSMGWMRPAMRSP